MNKQQTINCKLRRYFALFAVCCLLFASVPPQAFAGITASQGTLADGVPATVGMGANPGAAQTSVDVARRAVDQIDRAFDNPTALLGPNPTAQQLTQFNTVVGQYRSALPGMYGSFSNLDQLFGASPGEQGLISQGVQAASSINQIMRTFSNGQQGLGQGFQDAMGKLSAAENTINIIKNFGNTGLGAMREGQLALTSIGQLFPGLGQKLAPVAQALGALSNLQNSMTGMMQSFGNLGQNLSSTMGGLNNLSSRFGGGSGVGGLVNGQGGIKTTAAQDTTIFGNNSNSGADLTAQDKKDIEAVKADIHGTEASADAAKAGADKATGDTAAATNDGTKDTSQNGVKKDNGDQSTCTENYNGKSGGRGVPSIEQQGALLDFNGKTERLTSQVCTFIKDVDRIQKLYEAKELKQDDSKDAVASKIGVKAIEATRQKVKNEEPQLFLKNDKTQGPAFVRNQLQYYNEIRAQKAKNTLADINKNISGSRTKAYTDILKQSEQDKSDEEARLLGSLQLKGPGDDPEAELAKLDPVSRAFYGSAYPARYSSRVGAETLLLENQKRQDDAVKAADQELGWANGVRPKREVAQSDSEGNPRNFTNTSPGFLEKDLLSGALVTSGLNETTGVKTDTDLERTKEADKGPENVRSFTSSQQGNNNGGGLNGILSGLQALQQLACSFGASSMCGQGGNQNNGGGGQPTTPPASTPAPTITFSPVQTGIIEGSPYSSFTWSAENANSCTASNDWVTYGDIDPSVQSSASPREATTTPQVMQASGSTVPMTGRAVIFHPIVLKTTLWAEKAAQNRDNPVANLKNVGDIGFTKDSNNTSVQFAKFTIPTFNIDTNDLVHLDFAGQGVSLGVPARGTPPTGVGIAGSLVGAYAANDKIDPVTIVANDGADLLVETAVPYGTNIAGSASYQLSCQGAGGKITREIRVPFAPLHFATPVPHPTDGGTTPTKPVLLDHSEYDNLFSTTTVMTL